MAPLRLYVWGPAFGLPSLDAECLAAIAYVRLSVTDAGYELVASSPSAVPTNHLPALHDTRSNRWAAGYQAVLDLVDRHHGVRPAEPSRDPSLATARMAHLTAHASPLLALSLYVSSANYATTTRPALSAALSFPLGWTEAPVRRRLMARRAEHLGLSDLDTDADADEQLSAADSARKSFIPARLQPRRAPTVSAALTPEAKARFRLDAAAAAVLDVIVAAQPSVAAAQPYDFLAFAYLALMIFPDLPRPFLEDLISRQYPSLAAFVADARAAWLPPHQPLPWTPDPAADSPLAVASRLAAGCLAATLPGWSAWARARARATSGPAYAREVACTLGLGLLAASAATAATLLLRRAVAAHRFGAPLHVFERVRAPRSGLWALGAAGAALGTAVEEQRQMGVGMYARP